MPRLKPWAALVWLRHCHEHKQSLLRLKELATIAPVLAYCKPDQPVKLSADASSKGLGAVLIQDDYSIYVVRICCSTQHNSAQIKKEMFSVVLGCTKFCNYIYGVTNVTVESDHKPLEAILKATVPSTLVVS